ncbi:class I SAM-dependent methyltransferase [Dietzia aurantiaca]|uniref:class I SAM-dependent methyltransferase n=1 Tax=Dietzia aurantiaca TaxID=983873 RepID=UPI001E3D6110|nr:class I SAM-dependent methyltransferase [Dietzia aurantiaca]MCD2262016.1 class I SAM-dependent methyltransferase [Dietzia aurantiaca]
MTENSDRDDASFFSRGWVVASPMLERLGLARARRRLVAGLRGTVVEVGADSGVTFEHYPPEVTRVVAVEPDPHLRAYARRRAARTAGEAGAGTSIEVVDAVAEALPLADGEADAVVFGLVLCTVPDVPAALAEARRVLRRGTQERPGAQARRGPQERPDAEDRPGGEIRLLEHVRAPGRLGRFADRIAPVWGHVGGGCRPNQDTEALLAEAGFDVAALQTRPFPPVVPLMPMLTGSSQPVGTYAL